MRIADVLAQTLKSHGVRHVFGMPGGEVLTLLDGFRNFGLEFVLARHETAAAIMAAGAATATGAPGVVLTTLGPGLTNAINGIVDANQERVPLIVIAAEVDHGLRHRYTHQIFDQATLLRSVVKATFEIEPEGAGAVMARALRLAMTPPMGPVYVAVSPSTAKAKAQANDRPHDPQVARRTAVGVDDPAIAEVRTKLHAAKRPLIIAGWEAARSGASEALTSLSEKAKAPVITTYKAKGVIPESHALALGAAGLSPLADRHLLPVVANADVVLLAGYDPIEMRPGWLDPFGPKADVIEITEHPSDHAMHDTTSAVLGAVGPVCDALAGGIAPRSTTWTGGEISATQAALREAFRDRGRWGPHAIFAALQPLTDAGALITVDSGAHRILLSQQLAVSRPKGLQQSAGFCTMGAAVPLAIGAKVSEPSRHVIAVLGDGGLEMGLGELATLRDAGLVLTIVVLQDESLALIEMKQREQEFATAGVRLGRTKFEDIAAAMGGRGLRVADRSALDAALASAPDCETFTLIVCEIDARDYDGSI
ncbi:MAG: thiamine pyrophosphate-binding protein [Hyphomicrobium sp.]|nr:thiamine pyrophosphate-binding protein [Hyphomicrobium sp.]